MRVRVRMRARVREGVRMRGRGTGAARREKLSASITITMTDMSMPMVFAWPESFSSVQREKESPMGKMEKSSPMHTHGMSWSPALSQSAKAVAAAARLALLTLA